MVEYEGTQQSPLPPDQEGRFLYVDNCPTVSVTLSTTPCVTPILRERQHVQHSEAGNMRIPPHVPHPFARAAACAVLTCARLLALQMLPPSQKRCGAWGGTESGTHSRKGAHIASSRLYIKQSRELMQQLVLHPYTRTPARAKAGLSG